MAVSTPIRKKPQVVVEEESESDQSDEVESESEQGDDMTEVKKEIEDMSYDWTTGNQDLSDDVTEIKTEEELEIKEEDEGESSSDDISEDSDVEMDDGSLDENPKSKRKNSDNESLQKKKKVKFVDDESGTDSDEKDDFDDAETKEESAPEDSKSGLAAVMAQILGTKGGHNIMLSKAKKDHVVTKTEDTGEFEFVDADGNVKKDVTIKVEEEVDQKELALKKKLEKESLIKKFKLKPDFAADREKERKLRVIATQGVVQLFTAIEKHKVEMQSQRSETKSIVAREEISSQEVKASFLDILDREGEKLKKRSRAGKKVKKEIKEEPINLATGTKKPKWNVFADNFYKEPTLQGWDLKSDEED